MRFVIIGGGPAGVEAATTASRLGAEVTLIERSVIGGAANLWDCIPSKAMIAVGGMVTSLRRGLALGLPQMQGTFDLDALRSRVEAISTGLASSMTPLPSRQISSQPEST